MTRAINGVGASWAYDPLGRLTSEASVLGTFAYGYVGVTGRLATVTDPNGQTSSYSYLPLAQDLRLQTIHHQRPGGPTLLKFDPSTRLRVALSLSNGDYTYDAVGNILTWQQQADSDAPTVWRFGYDAADQLTAAVRQTTDPTPVVLARYGYGYDPAGNRTFEQVNDAVTAASHDVLNRLTAHQPGGALQFEGAVSEPATVTVAGKPAAVDAANRFRAGVPVSAGTNTVAITATDASGNVATATYEVDVTGTAKAFTYDANGNLTADGTRTFEWDAKNQNRGRHGRDAPVGVHV